MPFRARLPYYGILAAALPIFGWGFSDQLRQSVLPAGFPPAGFHYPARIAGIRVSGPAELPYLAEGLEPGSTVEVEAGGLRTAVRLLPEYPPSHLRIVLVTGLFFWAVCAVIFAPRAGPGPVRGFYWATLLYGVAILIGGVHHPRPPTGADGILAALQIGSLAFLPAILVHLSLTFPRRSRLVQHRPRLVPVIYGLAAVLALAETGACLAHSLRPGPGTWGALEAARRAGDGFLACLVFAAVAVFCRSARTAQLARERRQTLWVLLGVTLGATPYVVLRNLPRLLGWPPLISEDAALLVTVAIPLSFAIAVVRDRFLDIDVIVRRGLIYAGLAGTMVAVYLLLARWIGSALAEAWPPAAPYLPALGAGAAVSLFVPTRRVIAAWVDRSLFHIRYRRDRVLAALDTALQRATSQVEVALRLREFARQTFDPALVATVVRSGRLWQVEGGCDPSLAEEALALAGAGVPPAPAAAPGSTGVPERESSVFPPGLRDAGVRLVQPLAAGGRCLGVLLLGSKLSERRYIEPDLDLCAEACARGAASLERISLVQELAEQAGARRRLDELNRLKSDFLSRVAHDLRTPLASVAWSTRNLLDGVVGDLSPRQREYIDSVDVSAAQLGRLVTNLLELSRLEGDAARVRLEPVDLGGVAEEVVRSLRPLAAGAGVTLDLVGGFNGAGRVRGNRGKLFEVLANLFENAVKYLPPGSRVEIALSGDALAARVRVRDHGPGLPAGVVELFERFRQGSPSPYSQQGGFGLGLFVVRSYLDLFGGSVTAENDPGGGARFTCTLPAWAQQERNADAGECADRR